MATVWYTAKVRDTRILELPVEADNLGLRPGDEVSVSVDRNGSLNDENNIPNEGMLEALTQIEESQRARPYTSSHDTDSLLRQGRAGAIYGDESAE